MASDPTSLLVFSLVIVTVNIAIHILLKETDWPIALTISAAALVFFLQQAFYAYRSQQIGMLVQALGVVSFFSIFLFNLIHQMLLGLKEPAKTQQYIDDFLWFCPGTVRKSNARGSSTLPGTIGLRKQPASHPPLRLPRKRLRPASLRETTGDVLR
jgi:hypothetical protein